MYVQEANAKDVRPRFFLAQVLQFFCLFILKQKNSLLEHESYRKEKRLLLSTDPDVQLFIRTVKEKKFIRLFGYGRTQKTYLSKVSVYNFCLSPSQRSCSSAPSV